MWRNIYRTSVLLKIRSFFGKVGPRDTNKITHDDSWGIYTDNQQTLIISESAVLLLILFVSSNAMSAENCTGISFQAKTAYLEMGLSRFDLVLNYE
jgi:hypothetical protein